MHFFVAKNDTDDDVLDEYRTGVTANQIYSANYSFGSGGLPSQGGAESTVYVPNTSSVISSLTAMPYSKLMSNRIVRAHWRKLKTTSFVLAAADTQRVNVNMSLNIFGIKERLTGIALPYPKGCISTILEFQGVASKITTSADISFGAGSVGVLCTRKLNLAVMKNPNQRFNTNYVGQGTVIQGASVAFQEQFTEALTEEVVKIMT
jgi:hypothetical protein